jgi:PhnB protein
MIKKTINPFLHFNGNCREAIEYYRDIFNGNVELLMTAKGKFATEFPSENSILHSVLTFYNGMIIMASDTRIGLESTIGNNNFIVINFESEEEIDRVYALFAKDAINIREKLNKVFWGAKYAEFIDKFGICWMFNYDYPQNL